MHVMTRLVLASKQHWSSLLCKLRESSKLINMTPVMKHPGGGRNHARLRTSGSSYEVFILSAPSNFLMCQILPMLVRTSCRWQAIAPMAASATSESASKLLPLWIALQRRPSASKLMVLVLEPTPIQMTSTWTRAQHGPGNNDDKKAGALDATVERPQTSRAEATRRAGRRAGCALGGD